jgi:pimeloyl-ACP methyl ester carboxylesterase
MRLVYLHGFASGPGSSKARYFARRFAERGLAQQTPDLGNGDFEHLTVSGQLAVIERAVGGEPATLIGSSLGGYLAALYAARHPDTVERVVLLAPAFGFPRRWPQRLGPEKMSEWERTGWLPVYHYADQTERRVHWDLIVDGARYEDYPDVQQPCLIFHGSNDDVVDAGWSREFASTRPNVELHVVNSGHELTDVLEPMWERVSEFVIRP